MRALGWVLFAAACVAGGGPAAAEQPLPLPDGFWEHWGDGRAEISAYALTTPRYGELRRGTAVLVFVTEDFTHRQRVKSDGGHPDEYPVLKLNAIRDFQTGLYDYHLMTSTFLRLGDGSPRPAKVSMSMQEWCGHVYEQLLPGPEGLAHTSHSYFDGEADQQRSLPSPAGGLLLDAAPILVRGVVGPWIGPGQRREVPALPTLSSGRLSHRPPAWGTAVVSRGSGTVEVTVPAGTFEVFEVEVRSGGVATTWQVEQAWPHRIVRWSTTDGEVAELLGSERRAYWAEHAEGDEAKLGGLGLPVPGAP